MAEKSKKVSFFKSIKFRAWIGIFLLSILPLFSLGLYAFDAIGDVSRDILIEGNIQAFQQVKYEVDQYVSQYDELTRYIASDERFENNESMHEAIEAMRHLDQSYESIERIVMVDANGNLIAHSKKDEGAITELTFQESALARSNQSFMFSPEAFHIKASVSENPDSPSVISTISFLQLRKSLEGITFGTNFRYFLVTASGENILEQPNFPKEVIADLMGRPCGAYDLFPIGNKREMPQIAISLPILHYGLRIFVFQNAGEVYGIARKIGRNVFNFVMLLAFASFVLAIYFSWTITKPISLISDKAIELSEGKENVSVGINRDDEIGFLAQCFNSMSQKITRKITEISALYKVTDYISTSSTSRKALDLCLEHLVNIFKAKRGSIMLINPEHTALYVESFKIAGDNNDESIADDSENKEKTENTTERFELQIGEGIAGEVAATGNAILCMDCENDERFKKYSSADDKSSPKTLVSVPLSVSGRLIGVINLSDRSDSKPFTDDDLDLLQAIANQMAMSIDNARLHDMSVINEQTGLFVRKYLDIRLDDEIKRSKRFSFPLTVVLFSIDKLQNLNEMYGNHASDAALYDMGKLLKKTVRATDIPAEYEANKFCAILAHTNETQAKMFADRFIAIAADNVIKRGDKNFNITLSAGICQYGHVAEDFSDLLAKCDEALQISCKTGNTVTVYEVEEQK